MAATRIRAEDVAGIGIAVVAHVALFTWLVLSRPEEPPPPPPAISVTLQGPVAAEAGSPSREEAAAAEAPTLSEDPAPPAEAAPAPPQPQAQPQPQPRQVQPSPPRPQPKAAPPQPRAAPAPAPPRAQPRPAVQPPKAAAPRPSRVGSDFLPRPSRIGNDFLPASKGQANGTRRPGGASRIGNDFLPGASAGKGKAQTPPGPAITPQVRSSLASEVARQLKPRWQAPSGLDVELLATTVEWDLNPDGSLSGAPRVTNQTGVNAANRSQADRHKEQALRAVRLAAPFRLPPQFYVGWQHLRFTFDRKLSQ